MEMRAKSSSLEQIKEMVEKMSEAKVFSINVRFLYEDIIWMLEMFQTSKFQKRKKNV